MCSWHCCICTVELLKTAIATYTMWVQTKGPDVQAKGSLLWLCQCHWFANKFFLLSFLCPPLIRCYYSHNYLQLLIYKCLAMQTALKSTYHCFVIMHLAYLQSFESLRTSSCSSCTVGVQAVKKGK